MGLRNPSRLYVDPETDIPYAAWVGPDAGAPSATLGPVDVRERGADRPRRQLRLALLHGQRPGLPRPDRADGRRPAHATTHAPGYVSGGPATGGTARLVRLQQPPQRLAEQHRPRRAPARDRHRRWTRARCARSNLWYSRGNPDGANGCPEFPRERGADERAELRRRRRPQLCPYLDQRGHDRDGRPGLPLRRRRDGRLAPLAASTGTAAGSCTTAAGRASSTRCCSTRRPSRTAASPSTPTACATTLNWDAAYMDSKFGPDGALYVQVYDGFFRAGPNAGIWRFDYTGGPRDAGRGAAARSRSAATRSASRARARAACPTSGTSATARRRRPSRTRRTSYADARSRYTATLTVTYADGSDGHQRGRRST